MKRFIAILLVLLSVISYSFAEAPEQAETIKFMGLDWLTTRDDFQNALKAKDINYELNGDKPIKGYWSPFYGKSSDMYNDSKEIDYFSTIYFKEGMSSGGDSRLINVAGYYFTSIEADFLPTYSLEDLTVGEPYRLVRATYETNDVYPDLLLNGLTINDVYADLKEKLTALYGEPIIDKDHDIIFSKAVAWYAKDGTGVVMTITNNYYNYLKITYGIADDAKYINELLEVYAKINEQTLNNNTSTDGL